MERVKMKLVLSIKEKKYLKLARERYGFITGISRLLKFTRKDITSYFSYITITPEGVFLFEVDPAWYSPDIMHKMSLKYPNVRFIIWVTSSMKDAKYKVHEVYNGIDNNYYI
jgi:hypothetical protein